MSNLTITPTWHDSINQVETNEAITGGASGNANLATKQLAENIFWLKQQFDEKKVEPIIVGGLLLTTNNYASPQAVATGEGYGTWEKFGNGEALVSQAHGTNTDAPAEFFDISNRFGEYKHTLTIEEMPRHDHRKKDYNTAEEGDRTGETMHYGEKGVGTFQGEFSSGYSGNNKPHNIIQKSIVIGVWKRIA